MTDYSKLQRGDPRRQIYDAIDKLGGQTCDASALTKAIINGGIPFVLYTEEAKSD